MTEGIKNIVITISYRKYGPSGFIMPIKELGALGNVQCSPYDLPPSFLSPFNDKVFFALSILCPFVFELPKVSGGMLSFFSREALC